MVSSSSEKSTHVFCVVLHTIRFMAPVRAFLFSFKKQHPKDAIIKDAISKGNEVTSLPVCVAVETGAIHMGWGRGAVDIIGKR